MNDTVRDTLKKLIAQYGTDLCANRQKLEGLLRDFCGQHRGEIAVLVAAVREGVAEEIRKASGAQVDALLFHRLVQRLYREAGIALEFAEWAVGSWAAALGKQTPLLHKEGSGEVKPDPLPPDPERERRADEERINPKDGAEMVFIPAGEFLMGSNNSNFDDEKPQRKVYLDGYYIYKYPVTVAQYRQFCEATKRQMPRAPKWGWQDDHPIVRVSWHDAIAYCEWAGVRLPTEAEWEKAARGTDGRKYPWGNEWDANKCNSYETGPRQTTPVGSYPQGASPFGVYDMAGNVWEWCADWYDKNYYRSAPSKNPKGPGSGKNCVLRGGAWDFDPDSARCANRFYDAPAFGDVYIGFRCARTP